ncbi:DEAD/DEAH box helicase [Pseudoclavibacter caeni]|uniref:DEAD/DEAH box helicase n=1 Tax=Pseudoclavibacter caeni TaxID=908846 RepID=UPI001855355B|nr:DEAD/DEAH box helicase [Pseudoclavibacter caeni]NYJ97314.1 superfamily II DNA or RNA helicase [Pseudoclavibacter caeni]
MHPPIEFGNASARDLPPAYPRRAARGTAGRLRAWQREALELYLERQPRDFLAAATPGAGKTTFALQLAAILLDRGIVERVLVVAPTEHLKHQWAEAAARAHIPLDPAFRNADHVFGAQWTGITATYAQVAANVAVHKALAEARRTLVILDEVHHGGDALSWGDAIREAYGNATRRVCLTGTPFRSDDAMIPFVTYEPQPDGTKISRADYSYGYARALADGVVRPVIFLTYAGNMRWRSRSGDEMSADLAAPATKDIIAQAWRTALDPRGDWIASVLRAANARLTQVRRGVPDAGGLVIATDQTQARAYAGILREITGESATIVLSDEDGASERIERFAAGTQRWMVAVRMVSEGVDVPRLSVGVYATSASTPLFFAQVIGRFVRARRRGETATIFLPSVPTLVHLAHELEVERDHVLGAPRHADDDGLDDELVERANERERASDALLDGADFEPLEAQAAFDRVLFEGDEFGSGPEADSLEEQDFLGFPGLLEPDQVRQLLRSHQDEISRRRQRSAGQAESSAAASDGEGEAMFRRVKRVRGELNRAVSVWAQMSGESHASVHSRLRRVSGGPAVAQADLHQLEQRLKTVRGWMRRGRR